MFVTGVPVRHHRYLARIIAHDLLERVPLAVHQMAGQRLVMTRTIPIPDELGLVCDNTVPFHTRERTPEQSLVAIDTRPH